MFAKGNISEIFYSLQGEGLYAGVLQVFLRLSGCSLSCVYCDSLDAKVFRDNFSVVTPSGTEEHENPVTAEESTLLIEKVLEGLEGVHSISITGGEPLEQPDFLASLLGMLADGSSSSIPTYLETNGLFVDAARMVSPFVDIVALDIKLPSLCGRDDIFGIYDEVIPIFKSRGLFYKIVLMDGYKKAEFDEALQLLAEHDDTVPLVIQPATLEGPRLGLSQERLLESYRKASHLMKNVRVIPQIHRFIGLK